MDMNTSDRDIAPEVNESDEPITSSEVIGESVLIGNMSLEAILEGIDTQFDDYIDLKDHHNYVDIFYNQLENSYNAIDDENEHPSESREILDRIKDKFESTILSLFDHKLAIHLPELDLETDEVPNIILVVYEAFILNAHDVFMNVITKDILSKIKSFTSDTSSDDEWYGAIRDMLDGYSPIVTGITPTMFLKYMDNQQLSEYFDTGKISGNFLRKYSPRLYSHEEFEVELISNITIKKDVKEELSNAAKSTESADKDVNTD